MNTASVSTPSSRTSTETPFQEVSSFDHLVTQWMSLITVSDGSAASSFHVQRLGSSISPSMEKVHWSRLTRGVGPADSTGKSLTTYCPGGTWELEAASRRLPRKPREMNPIARIVELCYLARIRLFLGLCSTSAMPSASSSGGMYMPNRPRSPFFSPYHPPTGYFDDRPHASIVPSAAGICSSALPRSIHSPRDLSIECKSLMHRR